MPGFGGGGGGGNAVAKVKKKLKVNTTPPPNPLPAVDLTPPPPPYIPPPKLPDKPQIVKDAGDFITRNTEDVATGIESVKKDGTKWANKVSHEGGKIAEGDLNLEKAAKGTIGGIESTWKGSDIGGLGQDVQDYVWDQMGWGGDNNNNVASTPSSRSPL